jgi:CDGSH-type Zn-finger protein
MLCNAAAGDKKVLCRCWRSETFPMCNGAHVSHNKLTGESKQPIG